MPRFFKNLLESDKLIRVFCTSRLVHPVSIQLFGLAGGYDGFWLDAEHAGISTEQITMAALVGREFAQCQPHDLQRCRGVFAAAVPNDPWQVVEPVYRLDFFDERTDGPFQPELLEC